MTKKSDIIVSTYGFDGLEKTFENFQYKDKRKIFIDAFRKATKPTLDAAMSNVPRGKTDNLYRSLGVVPMRGDIGVWIGARIIGGYKGAHSHLVEDGTVERSYIAKKTVHFIRKDTSQWFSIKKGSKVVTGKMNPNASYAGFFRKAINITEQQVIDTIQKEWYDAIARFIVRSGKDK